MHPPRKVIDKSEFHWEGVPFEIRFEQVSSGYACCIYNRRDADYLLALFYRDHGKAWEHYLRWKRNLHEHLERIFAAYGSASVA